MKIYDFLSNQATPRPWINDLPVDHGSHYFQDCLLKLQLDSKHDKGSRRFEDIQQHSNWIHHTILNKASTILDAGCGPGFYSHELSRKGHRCYGVDISTLAIEHAKSVATNKFCKFEQADFLVKKYTQNFDFVLMPYSTFNTIQPDNAKVFLKNIRGSLLKEGKFYLEALAYAEPVNEYLSSWYICDQASILHHNPHLIISEQFWYKSEKAQVFKCHVIDDVENTYKTFISTQQYYENNEYEALLYASGFEKVTFLKDMPGTGKGDDKAYIAMLAL